MKKWLKLLLKAIPVDVIIDLFLDWLAEQAAKTENDLDDKAIEIIRMILLSAFGEKKGN